MTNGRRAALAEAPRSAEWRARRHTTGVRPVRPSKPSQPAQAVLCHDRLVGLGEPKRMIRTISRSSPLLLGSGSPRRREILEGLGIPLVVRAADVDEDVAQGESIDEYLVRVVSAKLVAVANEVTALGAAGALAADTIVVLDDEILGKPRDTADAVRLLRLLAGRQHRVLTRFAVSTREAPKELAGARVVESMVSMRAAQPEELERYAATGEGLDKAGAYALQGCGAFLVERIEGSHSNVIGLPACEVVLELRRLGLLSAFPFGVGA